MNAGRVEVRRDERSRRIVTHAPESTLALGADLKEPLVSIEDLRGSATHRTALVYLGRFERRIFDTRARDDRPNELVAGVPEFVPLLGLPDVVSDESREVVVELGTVAHSDALA